MIINQVGGGGKPEEMDTTLVPLEMPLVVLFKVYIGQLTPYIGAFNGERMYNAGTALLGDVHLYQSFTETGVPASVTGYGPPSEVPLSTHLASSSALQGATIFNASSVGAKKGSGRMFVYFARGTRVSGVPGSSEYGVYTGFTFDFTGGKDVITPEKSSVGGDDVRTGSAAGTYTGVVGYITNVTFE